MIFRSSSPSETAAIAARLAECLQPGMLLALTGTLGAGKTAFIQGLAVGLGIDATVTSPTFSLAVPYFGNDSSTSSAKLLHVDVYRIKSASELDDLAIEEALEDGAIVAIEWFEKFAAALPEADLKIVIGECPHQTSREIEIKGVTGRGKSRLDIMAHYPP